MFDAPNNSLQQSGLSEASFPRDLAIPQLLLSSAWAILPSVKDSSTTVFPHRGLAPHQFTPMSGAHHSLEPTRVGAFSSAFAVHVSLSRVAQLWRSAACT